MIAGWRLWMLASPGAEPNRLTTGSIRYRRCHGSLIWCVPPRAGPYERRAVSTRVNSVQNDDPGIPAPVSEERLMCPPAGIEPASES